MPANECIPFYRPGADLTAVADTAVTGKRFVDIAGDAPADAALLIEHATAAGDKIGVAAHDIAAGEYGHVISAPGEVVPVTATGAIAAGAEVEVGANGTAATLAAGVAVGRCLTGALDAADAKIKLY